MGGESWIIKPFNGVFIATFAAFVLLLVIASVLLRGRSEGTRRRVLVSACAVTLIGFFVYKYYLSIDGSYSEIIVDRGGFNWWGELPLQLCNINMILIAVAVLTKSRPLMCFGFFVAPLGALMALVLPGNGFSGYSLLLPRMLGYYGTHFMIVIEGWAIVAFGLFKPRFRDLPGAALTVFVLALAIHGVNMLMRRAGLFDRANYFYTVETEGNALLEIFHKWIPVPFLYLLPSIGILAVYMALLMGIFALLEKLRGREARA